MEQGGGEEGVPDTAFPFWMKSSLPWLPWLFFPQSFGEALPDSTYHIHGYPFLVQQLQGFFSSSLKVFHLAALCERFSSEKDVFKRGGVDKSMRNAQTELFKMLQGYDIALVPQYDAFVYEIHITPSTLVVCLLNLSSQAKTSRPRPECRKFERHAEEGSHLIVIIRIKFDK